MLGRLSRTHTKNSLWDTLRLPEGLRASLKLLNPLRNLPTLCPLPFSTSFCLVLS